MSKIEHPEVPGREPRLEPWLVVSLLAFIPGSLLVILPHATLVPLLVPICVSMIALALAALVMLVRAERRHRREEASAPAPAREAADGLELR